MAENSEDFEVIKISDNYFKFEYFKQWIYTRQILNQNIL